MKKGALICILNGCALLLIYAFCFGEIIPTVKSPAGVKTKYPFQVELLSFEKHLGKKLRFKGNPLFHEEVVSGFLKPVEKRLPKEPLVVFPNEQIGQYGGTLRGMALSYESGTSEILSWRQANFVRFSDDSRTIVPNVAKSWKWSGDYTSITFNLRKGHKWSDGAPFTADDVAFYLNDIILNKALHKNTPIPWRDFNPQVEKINNETVVFYFSRPFISLLSFLGGNGSYYDPFAPKHFLKQFHIKYNPDADKLARSKGFEDWTKLFKAHWNKWKDAVVNKASGLEVPTLESHVLFTAPNEKERVFIANPYYFKVDTAGNQLPYIDYHKERFIEKKYWVQEIIEGRVDQKSQNIQLHAYSELKDNRQKGDYKLQTPTGGSHYGILFNKTHDDSIKRKIYASPEFNWAISLAINRDEINETLFLGLCKPQQAVPLNSEFVTNDDKLFMIEYNPDKANIYLDKMGLKKRKDGFRLGPDGKPFSVFWEYSLQYVGSHKFVQLIVGYFNDIGIKMVVKELSTKELRVKQHANDTDITNEWVSPFEHTVFASPVIFAPPYGTSHPIIDIPWWEWKESKGIQGEEPPLWVKNLWELGDEFSTLIPGSEWYNAIGKQIVKVNLDNLSAIGILSDVPLITIVSNKLGNIPQWKINSYHYGYAYPYRADQWFFKK